MASFYCLCADECAQNRKSIKVPFILMGTPALHLLLLLKPLLFILTTNEIESIPTWAFYCKTSVQEIPINSDWLEVWCVYKRTWERRSCLSNASLSHGEPRWFEVCCGGAGARKESTAGADSKPGRALPRPGGPLAASGSCWGFTGNLPGLIRGSFHAIFTHSLEI